MNRGELEERADGSTSPRFLRYTGQVTMSGLVFTHRD